MSTRLIAYLWRNASYLSAWLDGFITGGFVFAIGVALLRGAA